VKELYNPKAFITHAAWLDQAFAHCPIFPTAASRRSLGRVSVPVWLIILSDQLLIVALVRPLPHQLANPRGPSFSDKSFPRRAYTVLAQVSLSYSVPKGTFPRVTHPSATPLATRAFDLHVLGLPPAFVLSQDQTLKFILPLNLRFPLILVYNTYHQFIIRVEDTLFCCSVTVLLT
jgi:hypothetical protein